MGQSGRIVYCILYALYILHPHEKRSKDSPQSLTSLEVPYSENGGVALVTNEGGIIAFSANDVEEIPVMVRYFWPLGPQQNTLSSLMSYAGRTIDGISS